MKITSKITVLLAICIAILGCNEPKKEITKYTIEQFYKNESIFGGSFSPDESKLLVTSNKTGIYNAYELTLDSKEVMPLTSSTEESVFASSYFPNDERILFSSDKGGNEISHIYLRELDGTVKDLTPEEEAKANFAGWARDKKSLFFISNKRDPRFFDLYEMQIEDFSSEMIYENNEGFDISGISKDKNYLALTKSITTTNGELYLYNRTSKELKHVSPHQGDAKYSSEFFTLDNKEMYYTTDEDSEFTYLMKYNLESGKKEKVWEAKWDVWYAYNSYNEKYRVIGVNEDAQTKVYVYDMETGKELQLPKIEGGNISSVSISRSEKLMRLNVSSAKSTGDMYLYSFENGDLTRLTNTLNPEIDPANLVTPQVVRYKSFDGMEIPAILYKPLEASVNNKVPALVWVHGGPGGQSRVSYFSVIQYLVNHGYAVIAVNNRGSSGYGKTFYAADNRKHGEEDLQDCVEAKKYLDGLGYIDTDKIGIIGGSYGGYMVMAALTYTPEEFATGVNIFGVTNWLRTLKSIPPYWESFRKALYDEMGDPFTDDSIRLHKISPVFHAKNVTKPLMVLQGANDPRVLQVESDEIVAAVKANGVPVDYVLFPDEGHGFNKKENEIKGYGQILTFLDMHLKGIESAKE